MVVEGVVEQENFGDLVGEGPYLEVAAEFVVAEVGEELAWLVSVTLLRVGDQHWFELDENSKVWP